MSTSSQLINESNISPGHINRSSQDRISENNRDSNQAESKGMFSNFTRLYNTCTRISQLVNIGKRYGPATFAYLDTAYTVYSIGLLTNPMTAIIAGTVRGTVDYVAYRGLTKYFETRKLEQTINIKDQEIKELNQTVQNQYTQIETQNVRVAEQTNYIETQNITIKNLFNTQTIVRNQRTSVQRQNIKAQNIDKQNINNIYFMVDKNTNCKELTNFYDTVRDETVRNETLKKCSANHTDKKILSLIEDTSPEKQSLQKSPSNLEKSLHKSPPKELGDSWNDSKFQSPQEKDHPIIEEEKLVQISDKINENIQKAKGPSPKLQDSSKIISNQKELHLSPRNSSEEILQKKSVIPQNLDKKENRLTWIKNGLYSWYQNRKAPNTSKK